MSKRTKVTAILVASAVGIGAVAVTTINSVTSGIRESATRTAIRAGSPHKILKAETRPGPSREAVEKVLASEAKRSEEIAMKRAEERAAATDYWWDPAEHFTVQGLQVFKSTRVSGLGKVTGRVTNVGIRDAEYLRLTFRLLDAQGRRVGRATAVNHDGLRAGESWDFDAVMAAHTGGAVEVRLDPNGVEAR